MSKLVWDAENERIFETGVEKAALYPYGESGYEQGVAWNGFTGFTESPSGAESTPLYANNKKYLNLVSAEDFAGTIEAYTYPEEFEKCDGTAEIAPGVLIGQQNRSKFGLVYKTLVGNDTEGESHGYKLHIVYGALAAPSEKARTTINESPEATTFSWEVSTTPVEVAGHKPTAKLTIDSRRVGQGVMTKIESKLYGGPEESNAPMLLLPDEIVALIGSASQGAIVK